MRFLLFLTIILSSCTYDEIDLCSTQEPSFSECVKPIIEQNCVTCHRNNSQNGLLQTFEEIKSYMDNGKLLDRIQRDADAVGVMPPSGQKLSNNEIQIIKTWYENGTPNN